MTEPRLLRDGLGLPESTRWHDGRIWVCNWGTGEVIALDDDGRGEVVTAVDRDTIPFSIDWLPDGRLLVVDGPKQLLMRQEPDGTLAVAAHLGAFGPGPYNELVVDPRGRAYVNGGPGLIACVEPDGTVRRVADGLQWPNGMAIVDDGRTLIAADSHARQLVAFAIRQDGALHHRRVWAELEHAPDGICADADGAVWVATVPGRQCLRVREGGQVVASVPVDRGCFACMLGGHDGRTLFVAAARWRGMEATMTSGPGSTGQLLAVADQAAPHAGRP